MNSSSVLIQSLQNPVRYPHTVKHLQVIETHISWVILTGSYAYKIKKPLNLGFLDFSSLDKRKHYCHEELRLDSRLAPDIYLDVVAISGTEHQPNIAGEGPTIEYAVKMRQFEQDKVFDRLLANKQLSKNHIQQTANVIAAFHNNIDRAKPDTVYGRPDQIIQPVRENFSQILALDGIEKPIILEQLQSWSESQHSRLKSSFQQRKHAGFIRECHGDLHLGNIALIDDKVVPFDGIEFNPSLYWIDVMSEVAFLVMDLQEKKRPDQASRFLNVYLQVSGDYSGLKLLRFYQTYRAMVRAKVNAIRASQSSSAQQHQTAISSYQNYLQLASSYMHTPRSVLMIMHGVSGSGKSWLSEQIIDRYPVIRIRSDVERKRLHNLAARDKSHSGLHTGLYDPASTELTYQHLLKLSTDIIQAGYSVIVDATFLKKQYRQLFSQLAEQLQVEFLIIQTHTDKPTLLKRIAIRAGQKDNVSEADQTVLENQLDAIEPLSSEELENSITVDTNQANQVSGLWHALDKAGIGVD